MIILLVNDKIRPQYAYERMYDGMTRKIPLFRFQKRQRTAISVTANFGACLAHAHAL